MVVEIFGILIVTALIIVVCIFGESIAHPQYSLAECTRKFKADAGAIVSVLFSSDPVRHIFDASLWENFLAILKEYCHDAFTPAYQAEFFDGTPRIQISFVPSRALNVEELNRLCKLLCLKLRQYLHAYGLSWRMFGEYHVLNGTVVIYLYYSEFKEDLQPFLKRYRLAVKNKVSADHGVLHDEELDREINYAKPKC